MNVLSLFLYLFSIKIYDVAKVNSENKQLKYESSRRLVANLITEETWNKIIIRVV